jgi:hypothetical protein
MIKAILAYVTGSAAKAGMAFLTSALTTGGGAAIITGGEFPDAPLGEYSILGYVIIGAIGGLMNWATVYWKRNH